jgi:elongation factor P--(R)-beta-lysine ligase
MSLVFERAKLLRMVRAFFEERNVLEVDCHVLVSCPQLDHGIDAMEVAIGGDERGYLHTSPEYAMKRLLSQGIGDLYYLGHVFRKGERGTRHHPEFTMIEWYRVGMSFDTLIEETCALIGQFLGRLPVERLTYREAFIRFAALDPYSACDLPSAAHRLGIDVLAGEAWNRDDWLDLILNHAIEPKLGEEQLTVLFAYPPSQAALARVKEQEGSLVAERFEIYYQGIELANGYHELTDAHELRQRFDSLNQSRRLLGKEPYPLDEALLTVLEALPDCCGVSVGFDRLMMLRYGCTSLYQIFS